MSELLEPPASRRRSLRRSVHLETGVLSDSWDGEVSLLATNLSPDGVWVQTALPLDPGDEVVVSLRPPRWQRPRPLVSLARVARVGLHRRRRDGDLTGMGLAFVGLGVSEASALAENLRGMPPPLPGHGQPTPVSRLPEPQPGITLADGSWVALQGDGELLTGGRRRLPTAPTFHGLQLAPAVPPPTLRRVS